MQEQQKVSLEARKQALTAAIARYVRQGYRVVNQTDTTAQLVRPKQFSCLWATLWFLVFGIGLLIYIFYYMSKKDDILYLIVDEFGRVHRRK